jgi:serine protease Do
MIQRKLQFLALSAIVAVSVTAGMFLATGLDLTPPAAADQAAPRRHENPPAYSLPNFADIAERANPAVVSITSTAMVQRRGSRRNPLSSPFEFFFGPNGEQDPDADDFGDRRDSGGSGFIISDDGYILTNYHVVEDADRVQVSLADDSRDYDATIIGSDPPTDLALIKIDVGKPLPVIPLGDSDRLRVGEWVVAIGNPLIWDHTLTVGVVSAKERQLPAFGRDASFDSFIQTDAAINFGNSGGPLLNLYGEAIGINTAIAPDGQGIGFAVPINMATQIMDQLKEAGRVSRGFLGISILDIGQMPPDDREWFGLEEHSGAFVRSVTPGLPAEVAGVRHGDAIISVDGKQIGSSAELIAEITRRSPQDRVKLEVVRDKESLTLTAKLVDRETANGVSVEPARSPEPTSRDAEEVLGFTAEPVTPEVLRYYDLDSDDGGVVVTSVDPMSVAYDKGLREGFLILEVNRAPVDSMADFRRELAKVESGKLVNLYVRAGTVSSFLVLRLGEKD